DAWENPVRTQPSRATLPRSRREPASPRTRSRGLFQMRGEAGEQAAAVGAAHDVFDVVFRMRHHAEHVALVVDDAGDGLRRAVHIADAVDAAVGRAIAIEPPALAFEPLDGLFVRSVIALTMGDRHADHLAGIVAARERRVGTLHTQMHVLAD